MNGRAKCDRLTSATGKQRNSRRRARQCRRFGRSQLNNISPGAARIHLPANHRAGDGGCNRGIQHHCSRSPGFNICQKHAQQKKSASAAGRRRQAVIIPGKQRQTGGKQEYDCESGQGRRDIKGKPQDRAAADKDGNKKEIMAECALLGDAVGNLSGDDCLEIPPDSKGGQITSHNIAGAVNGKQDFMRAGQATLQRFGISEMLFFPLTKQSAPRPCRTGNRFAGQREGLQSFPLMLR
ncbi:hypothetical protein AGR3A_Cc260082 [Agrobacterium tomkonis CFBP 6623]|uniref:Uncharacterized protein n=1 Tax=Agrobacterium tomkonis CFBP 6623 TaxID=1183432 RepID=A0A1S7PI85_9HYPH|nr:hypothetical protein AGR3A_Cc260082 [Agrobacterium tomkonis CFBP 6623]